MSRGYELGISSPLGREKIIHERAMFAPVLEPAFLNGVGPRVDHHGLGVIANFPYSAPYEDLTLKAR